MIFALTNELALSEKDENKNELPKPPGAPDRTPVEPPINDPKDKPVKDPKKPSDDWKRLM